MTRVQLIHGLEGSPQGLKAQTLARSYDCLTPAMNTADFADSVARQALALAEFQPEVLVGSSFGGAVALALLTSGAYRGPTLLLAQAGAFYGQLELPLGVPVLLVHGTGDTLIDPEQSRALARTGSPELVQLLEVDDDHSLRKSVEAGALIAWVEHLRTIGV